MKKLLLFLGIIASISYAQTRTLVTFSGAWASTTTYNVNDEVLTGGVLYISLISSNLNLAPASNPSDWSAIGSSGGTVTTNALTLNNSGSGSSSGTSFNGSAPATLSYNTIGSPGIAASNTFTGSTNSFVNVNASNMISAPNINNVLEAENFPGSDIGAKINAAIASLPGTASVQGATLVKLQPNVSYTFTTKIQIPNNTSFPYIFYTALDCQGSALIFNGTGDAIDVAEMNSNQLTGAIRNCYIFNLSSTATNGVHQHSRVSFEYLNDYFQGWNEAAGTAALYLDGDAQSWGGYSERTRIEHCSWANNSTGLWLRNDGGTGSFARLFLEDAEFNLNGNQTAMAVTGNGSNGSANVYDSFIDIRGNAGGGSNQVIRVESGGWIRTSVLNVGFEGDDIVFDIADVNSQITNSGGVLTASGITSLCSGCSEDQAIIPNLTNFSTPMNVLSAVGASGVTVGSCGYGTTGCTTSVGAYPISGTFTTGTFLTITYPYTIGVLACQVTQQGGSSWHGLLVNSGSTTGFTVSAANSIAGDSFFVTYSCKDQNAPN